MPYVDFNVFSLHSTTLIFARFLHIAFDYELGLPHRKKKETYLLYDSHVQVIQEIISFLDHQDIQNSNWSNSAYHPFSCHMLIASAIFLILGMQVIIVMYKIIGYRSCNTERCKIYKYIYIQGKTEKKLVILFHNSQIWLN